MEPETLERCARGCCPSQAEHYRTLTIGKGDLSPETADVKKRDNQLVKDRDAYKRLRQDGVQPPSVDGSAALESRVVDQVEIDFKIPIPKADLPRVKDIVSEIKMGEADKVRSW